MKLFKKINDIDVRAVDNGLLYVYVVENYPQGYVKIGVSHDVRQRIVSLSGSNGGGNKLIRCAVSQATYLYTLERIIHNHFNEYRINGTEWFKDVSFDDVVAYIDYLFTRDDYKVCNKIRRDYVQRGGVKC